MLIQDRIRQLRKAIPAAITELSAEAAHPQYVREQNREASKRAAIEFRLLAQALLAASEAALITLDPKPPEKHEHFYQAPRLGRPVVGVVSDAPSNATGA